MRVISALFVSLFLYSGISFASDNVLVDLPEEDIADITLPTRAEEAIVSLPYCEDEELISLVKDIMTGFSSRYSSVSVVDRRRKDLMIKNFTRLDEIYSSHLTSKDDVTLANTVVMLKINEGVLADDIRVCQGPYALQGYLYVLLYKKNNIVHVKILNFADQGQRESDLEFML